jgi:hypothetical protein
MSGRGWRRLPRIGRPDVDAEVRAEIESHLEMQAQELMDAGYTPERARWEAARRFGDRHGVEREVLRIDRAMDREVRRTQHLEDLMLDIRALDPTRSPRCSRLASLPPCCPRAVRPPWTW